MSNLILGIMIGGMIGIFTTVYSMQFLFRNNMFEFRSMMESNPIFHPAQTVGTVLQTLFTRKENSNTQRIGVSQM